MPFPYKTALITGATSGIGRALAERMLAHDIFVIAVGRRRDRLDELVATYGTEKVAVEEFDVTDLSALPEWTKKITTAYPTLDCLVLNAGIQRTLDFTSPATISLETVDHELLTNYTSPVHTIAHFLPHLQSLRSPSASPDDSTTDPSPAAIILVSSGLGLIPLPRVPNYCATKAALHSLAWTLRSQFQADATGCSSHIRILEIIPPAVRTELHMQQADLAAAGIDPNFGLPLEDFLDEAWAGLCGDEDEIPIAGVKERFYSFEKQRKAFYLKFVELFRMQGSKA